MAQSEMQTATGARPDESLKIIAVTGATGSQGGGVVNIMKKTPGWKVRALTRNPESDAAKKLVADGVEVVQADFDDESSLQKSFKVSKATTTGESRYQPLAGRPRHFCRQQLVGTPLQREKPR
jgi:NADP-dependent 3-hydroxy acid dehydrogenase YdfG